MIDNHFVDVNKMVKLGSGGEREIDDIMLTRYACYLIAQKGDPRKEQIAFAQSYFAIQTRKDELAKVLGWKQKEWGGFFAAPFTSEANKWGPYAYSWRTRTGTALLIAFSFMNSNFIASFSADVEKLSSVRNRTILRMPDLLAENLGAAQHLPSAP